MISHDIVVLGGGISGLAVSWNLHKKGINALLLEKEPQVGGNIKSVQKGNFLLERGPNSLLVRPDVSELIEELGLTDQLIPANAEGKIREILWNNKLHRIAPSPLSILQTPLLNFAGKLKLFRELFVKSTSQKGETTFEFFSRRFGRQLAERIAGAMISGIYAGDIRELEMEAIFPQLIEMEKEHASIIRGMIRQKSGAREIVGLQEGLQQIPIAIANRLGEWVQTESTVEQVKKIDTGWAVVYSKGGERMTVHCKKLVSTLPAYVVEPLLADDFSSFSEILREIQYNPMLLLHVKADETSLKRVAPGFGFLASIFERQDYIGTMYNSVVFNHVAPTGDKGLCTFFVKPSIEDFALNAQETFEKLCEPKFREWTQIQGQLKLIDYSYWQHAIPQKTVGHMRRLSAISEFENEHKGLHFAGNYRSGVSVSDCISYGKELASKLMI